MSTRRERWDREAVRLKNTIESGNPSTIKGARTRLENAHRDYWTAVHKAWDESRENPGSDLAAIAQRHGVLVSDIAEIAR